MDNRHEAFNVDIDEAISDSCKETDKDFVVPLFLSFLRPPTRP